MVGNSTEVFGKSQADLPLVKHVLTGLLHVESMSKVQNHADLGKKADG